MFIESFKLKHLLVIKNKIIHMSIIHLSNVNMSHVIMFVRVFAHLSVPVYISLKNTSHIILTLHSTYQCTFSIFCIVCVRATTTSLNKRLNNKQTLKFAYFILYGKISRRHCLFNIKTYSIRKNFKHTLKTYVIKPISFMNKIFQITK